MDIQYGEDRKLFRPSELADGDMFYDPLDSTEMIFMKCDNGFVDLKEAHIYREMYPCRVYKLTGRIIVNRFKEESEERDEDKSI